MSFGKEVENPSAVATALIDMSRERDKAWQKSHSTDDGVPPMVWASDAGKCTRQIGYRLLGHEGEPMDDRGRHVTQIGNVVHEAIQEHLDMEDEVRFTGHKDDEEHPWIRGRVDLDDGEIAYDIKTAGSVKMKTAKKEGADMAHLLQSGIGAFFLGRSKARVTYIGKEAMWKNVVAQLGMKEGDLGIVAQEYEIDLSDINEFAVLQKELDRLRKVYEFALEGKLPPRYIPFMMPPGARVTDPSNGAWTLYEHVGENEVYPTQTGRAWICNYCSYQTQCTSDMETA